MYSTKIKIQYNSGSPASGKKVVLSISGILSGGVTSPAYTDNKGIVVINHSAKGEAKIIVSGTTKGTLYVPGETVLFI